MQWWEGASGLALKRHRAQAVIVALCVFAQPVRDNLCARERQDGLRLAAGPLETSAEFRSHMHSHPHVTLGRLRNPSVPVSSSVKRQAGATVARTYFTGMI